MNTPGIARELAKCRAGPAKFELYFCYYREELWRSLVALLVYT
jgi:hypothetical protein